MADSNKKPGDLRTRSPAGVKKGTTIHGAKETIEAIYLYVNPSTDENTGTVGIFGRSGTQVQARLVSTVVPAGSWRVKVDIAQDMVVGFSDLTFVQPEARKAAAEKQLREALDIDPPPPLYEFQGPDGKDDREKCIQMHVASKGAVIRLVVAYSKKRKGNSTTLPDKAPLEGGNTADLLDEEIARLYVAFVQHFGDRTVDLTLAAGGLTLDEVDAIEQGRPEIQEITSLFLRLLVGFRAAKSLAARPEPTLDNFRAMAETVFFQKAAGNDLAVRNQLTIAIGLMLVIKNEALTSEKDIGVARLNSGDKVHLLYDRNGVPVRSLHSNIENRSIDMNSPDIPSISLTVSDPALYAILRGLEQQIGDPSREVLSLAVNLFRHTDLIVNEMLASGTIRTELQKQIIECAPAVLAFFVAHAMVQPLLASGHPAGPALLLLLRGAGFILGVDGVLGTMGLMAQTGHEFHRVEFLNRTAEGEEAKRTELSQIHLRRGAVLLVQAMAEYVAGGVVMAVVGGGGIVVRRVGSALVKGIAAGKTVVRAIITVRPKAPPVPGEQPKDFIAERIESKNSKTEIDTIETAHAKPAEGKSGKGVHRGRTPEVPKPGEKQLPTDDGPANRRDERKGNQPTKPQRPKDWEKFDERFDDAFRARLREFRGNDDTNTVRALAGQEGRLFLSTSKPGQALKRWFQSQRSRFIGSVQKLIDGRAAVDADPQLSQHIEVVKVLEQGEDFIVRDFHDDSRTLKEALLNSNAAQAARAEVQEMLASSTNPILVLIRKKLVKPSANLHWSDRLGKIIVIDLE